MIIALRADCAPGGFGHPGYRTAYYANARAFSDLALFILKRQWPAAVQQRALSPHHHGERRRVFSVLPSVRDERTLACRYRDDVIGAAYLRSRRRALTG